MNRSRAIRARRNPLPPVEDDLSVKVRFASTGEVERWDELILQSPDEGTVYRSQANIDGMILQGYRPVYLMLDDMAVTAFQVDVGFVGSMWVLFGPPVADAAALINAAKSVAAFAGNHGISAVRVRPQIKANTADERLLDSSGLKRVPAWLDDHTVIVDLTGSEDDVYYRFKKRARKAIRRSSREGVVVTRVDATDNNCLIMFEMLRATSNRRFDIPNRDASVALFKRFDSSNNGQLFFAMHQDTIVAAAFVSVFGQNALYMGAGSARKNPGDSSECGLGRSGAAYAMQWEIMRWARSQGCTRYDLDGTPSSLHAQDPLHPRSGVGQFKTAFSKDIVDYLGAYQIAVHPIRAWGIRQIEITYGRVVNSRLLNAVLGRKVMPNPDHVWLRRGPLLSNAGLGARMAGALAREKILHTLARFRRP